ncbi:biotin/lipoyl-containing protein, partial [Pseudarthrobacter enclensis]|nr:pyruvate/2-oxoglutarate dehydrogenase complex dihydrolipoamide acyltransferase (E2) component [Pseudarthrobacter enclensis]
KVEETLESPASGVLAEIVVPEGETVDVRSLIAYIETA